MSKYLLKLSQLYMCCFGCPAYRRFSCWLGSHFPLAQKGLKGKFPTNNFQFLTQGLVSTMMPANVLKWRFCSSMWAAGQRFLNLAEFGTKREEAPLHFRTTKIQQIPFPPPTCVHTKLMRSNCWLGAVDDFPKQHESSRVLLLFTTTEERKKEVFFSFLCS